MNTPWDGLGQRPAHVGRPRFQTVYEETPAPVRVWKLPSKTPVQPEGLTAAALMRWVLQHRGPKQPKTLARRAGVNRLFVELLLREDLASGRIYMYDGRYHWRK